MPSTTHVQVDTEFGLWNAAFAEVVRQVYVHCNERGQLLESIRARYGEIIDGLLRFKSQARSVCYPSRILASNGVVLHAQSWFR